jgi:hypothetical protein
MPIKVCNGIYSIAWSVLIVVCAGKFVAPIYTPIIQYPPLADNLRRVWQEGTNILIVFFTTTAVETNTQLHSCAWAGGTLFANYPPHYRWVSPTD